MLRVALLFFVLAIIAAFVGFPVTGDALWSLGQVFFFIFLVLAVLALLGGLTYRNPPPV